MEDLTSQRFGRLVALEPTDKRSGLSVVWRCRCDCGNVCEVASGNLRSGRTRSCGCLRKENAQARGRERKGVAVRDLTSQRFGRLVALEPTDKRSGLSVVWRCRCDCGNVCEVASGNLRSGRTRSCGCLRKEKVRGVRGRRLPRNG